MPIPRRRFLRLAAGALALPALARAAQAQAYPSRPVRIVVGFAAGGPLDIVARLMAQWLSERLGQQFVVENRPGAGGNIATEAVVNAPPDGYTLLMVSAVEHRQRDALRASSISTSSATSRRSPASCARPTSWWSTRRFPPRRFRSSSPMPRPIPARSTMASAGNGTSQHVAGELFKMMTGVDMVHVPYRGAAPALTDLFGGQVQVMFGTTPTSIEYIRAGKLRPLAVTTTDALGRVAGRPDHQRFRAGLRGERMVRHRRAQEYAGRDRRRRSTARSMRALPTRSSRRGSRVSAAPCCRARRPSSASCSPTKPRSGPRWSSSPAPSRS